MFILFCFYKKLTCTFCFFIDLKFTKASEKKDKGIKKYTG